MAKYRKHLPQLGTALFLTDGGLETTLIFQEGLDLPYFAAFDLLKTPEGQRYIQKYFRRYAEIAKEAGTGLILESATWRASADWGRKLGYDTEALAEANRKSIEILQEIRSEYDTERTPVVISGCLGPRGDGYVPDRLMSAKEAEAYHQEQIDTFSRTSVDMVTAITMNYVNEAVGITRAARNAGLPVAISFTVETDGRLPGGKTLKDAIEEVDAATSSYPVYYMINCAHPTHFDQALPEGEPWLEKVRGLRANASKKSHAELDESTELDAGDPAELGKQYAGLVKRLSKLTVVGGCCGTDHRHVEKIAGACAPLF